MAEYGVLLLNLGSPSALSKGAIRRYLREFLSDRRVIDINPIGRFLLVNAIIAPFRPRKVIESYAKIWTKEGSPLIVNTRALTEALTSELGSSYKVRFGMRYGEPGMEQALRDLDDCQKLIVVPLYPHYATSSTGSSLAKLAQIQERGWDIPNMVTLHHFYKDPAYIDATAAKLSRECEGFAYDHILFSYHGIPERHLEKSDCDEIKKDCRHAPCPKAIAKPDTCYRYQCYATSRLVAEKLGLNEGQYSTSFQSRLGRTPWIKPYTDIVIEDYYKKGVRNLLVTSPSFIADCLETTDELGIRLAEQWLEHPETEFKFVSCLNSDPLWVKGLAAHGSRAYGLISDLEFFAKDSISNFGAFFFRKHKALI